MVFGIGTDIIEIERIRKSILKEHFKLKLFSEREIAYCEVNRKAESYAARFAGKEAFFKALGTGWRDGLVLTEVEILNDELGKPYIELSGKTKQIVEDKGVKHIHISLSHSKENAIAFVVLEK
ncbi:MAG TPA: holo-ACP synthase [Chitinophagales bacterium]